MPTESFDHGRVAALLTELNRAERKAPGGGQAAVFVAFACGVVAVGAGVMMTPAQRTVRATLSASSQVGQTVTPQAYMRRQPSGAGDNLLAILDVSAPLPPARSVIRQPSPPPPDAGPALEPDLDGDLAIMPKAPVTLVRTPPTQANSLVAQGDSQPG